MGAATGIARVRRDNKQMDFIFAAYRKAHPKEGPDISPDAVADWAAPQTDLWNPKPISRRDRLRRQLARSLQEKYITDDQGREVRANHPIFRDVLTPEGVKRRAYYYPLFDAPGPIARQFFSWRRNHALGEVVQQSLDFGSWLDNNKFHDTLDRPDYNFNIDLDELKQPTEYLDSLEDDDDTEGEEE